MRPCERLERPLLDVARATVEVICSRLLYVTQFLFPFPEACGGPVCSETYGRNTVCFGYLKHAAAPLAKTCGRYTVCPPSLKHANAPACLEPLKRANGPTCPATRGRFTVVFLPLFLPACCKPSALREGLLETVDEAQSPCAECAALYESAAEGLLETVHEAPSPCAGYAALFEPAAEGLLETVDEAQSPCAGCAA